ncbi:unnamed protein product [Rhodiola kirilowii]
MYLYLYALQSTPIWVMLALILSGFPLLGVLMKKRCQIQRRPPTPPKLPIIGNLHQLGTLPHQSLARLAEKYGPVMFLQLGFEPCLVISSTEAAKEALKTHDIEYSSRPAAACIGKLTYNYADMAFTPYSEYWREMKKICIVELFSLKRVQSFRPVRNEMIDVLLESLAISASKGELVDLCRMNFELNANITFEIAFGKSFKGSMMDGKGFQELLHETTAMLGVFSAADFFPYVGWIYDKMIGLHSRLGMVFEKFDEFFRFVIEEHMRSEKARDDHEDIVDVLLRIQREHIPSGATRFTMNNIKGILTNIFLGGVDTIAVTTVWALAELVKNPEVMKKVQDELRQCTTWKNGLNEKDIENLNYFKMVLKETMRLHPVAPLLVPRKTTANTQMFNYPNQEGTRVFINAWAIARDPKKWKQPEKFIPERFADSPIDYKGQHFEFLPFGGGGRICPGINMAMATIELVLANILYRFDWKLPDGMTLEELNMEEGAGMTAFKKVLLKLLPINYQC